MSTEPCPADALPEESGSPSEHESQDSDPLKSLLLLVSELVQELRRSNDLTDHILAQNSILIQSLADEDDDNDDQGTYLDGSRR